MLKNLKTNCLGTTDFDAQFAGMRKPQQFTVYPVSASNDPKRLLIQSDTRIGFVHLCTGEVWMSKAHPSGAYFHHLVERTRVGVLSQEDLFRLKAQVFGTAHGAAGATQNGVVHSDNSGALEVFS